MLIVVCCHGLFVRIPDIVSGMMNLGDALITGYGQNLGGQLPMGQNHGLKLTKRCQIFFNDYFGQLDEI